MSAYDTRRYLAEYRAATDNEIAVDLFFLAQAGQQPETIGCIPRVPLWWGRFSNRPKLALRISQIVGLFWRLTAGMPFHLLSFTRLLAQRYQTKSGGSDALQDFEAVGLAFSRRSLDVSKASEISAPPLWIIPPWVEAEPSPSDRRDIPLLSLVSPSDLTRALWLSILATVAIGHDRRRRKWILQTYTALPWMLSRIALSRIKANLVITEHFDRWAVLADVVTRARKRVGAAQTRLTLIQHGHVGNLDSESDRIRLKYRLAGVSSLYVYDDMSAAVFRTEILDRNAASRVSIQQFTPRITLTKLDDTSRFKILFVGHPMCADLQIRILDGLQNEEIFSYYKPHPASGLPQVCLGKEWHIITERDLFPEVDLLIAYHSTLVTEYQQYGIATILHELSEQNANSRAEELIINAKHKLSSLKNNH